MKILEIQVLNGPNYWSKKRKKLMVMTIDLEHYEFLPTNLLPGFNDSIKKLIPSLYDHRCSPGVLGGFYMRLDEGTWLGHVIEHVALEIQTLAGMDCGFGRTYGANKEGVYQVIFNYELENAGVLAAKAAFELVHTLAAGKAYNELENTLVTLNTIRESEQLGPSTASIVHEAQKRNIPVRCFKNSSLVILGQGCNQKKIWATVSSQTSSIAVEIASNKELTKSLLEANFIPVPKGITVKNLEELDKAITNMGFPLVLKPLNGNHGRGVLTHITTKEKAIIGFEIAKKISESVIVERLIKGEDYRLLVVNYKMVAAAKRTPAQIIGNGIYTIQELIEHVNKDPKRGLDHENMLTRITVDDATLSILMEQNLSLDSILPPGEALYLKGTANLSAGGTACDVTDLVHPDTIHMAERIARLVQLDICGIDIIAQTISEPINQKNGAIIEVNAGPGLRMHLDPSEGKKRNVASAIIDMLYPEGTPATIPVVAVTGTNGKTTVVRLIAHLAKKASYNVGFTTTEGIYLQDHLSYSGDCSGPLSSSTVLSDSLVDFAVLECARGGILRSGLSFDECDISVITNITEDHLGLKEIHSLEDLARVKSVVAYSTKQKGHSILNADDDLVYKIKQELTCNVALFGLAESDRIKEHCSAGGLACYIENEFIIVKNGKNKHYLAQLNDIPLTLNGTATCMIQNILPAVLAGVISNIPLTEIANALYEFLPVSDNLPGRMNVFNFHDYQIMIDYAHNEGAYIELNKYIKKLTSKRKIGIISATGDRRPKDIQNIGYYAAQMFDEIIIKHDKNGRGSSNEYLTELIKQGVVLSKLNPKVHVISDEFEAVHYALQHTTPDTFIFYAPEDVFSAINFIKKEQKKRISQTTSNESVVI